MWFHHFLLSFITSTTWCTIYGVVGWFLWTQDEIMVMSERISGNIYNNLRINNDNLYNNNYINIIIMQKKMRTVMITTLFIVMALVVAVTADAKSTHQVVSGPGLEDDIYKVGDVATASFTVTNNGDSPITSINIALKVQKHFGFLWLGDTKTVTLYETILPGETKTIKRSETIPANVYGFSTRGTYRIYATVYVGGKKIGGIEDRVTITN